jgi:cysteine desulfurase
MGVPTDIAHGSLRLTVGKGNTVEEIEYVLQELPLIIEGLRTISPLYASRLQAETVG